MAPEIDGVAYADNYEEITGKKLPQAQTKVVTADDAAVETKAPEAPVSPETV